MSLKAEFIVSDAKGKRHKGQLIRKVIDAAKMNPGVVGRTGEHRFTMKAQEAIDMINQVRLL